MITSWFELYIFKRINKNKIFKLCNFFQKVNGFSSCCVTGKSSKIQKILFVVTALRMLLPINQLKAAQGGFTQ